MNNDAGHGGRIIMTLRLEDGEELPFLVDTGSPLTLFDKSFEPKLGKRLGTMIINSLNGDKQQGQQGGRYAAPKLYLGNTLLVTGRRIVTHDFGGSSRTNSSVMGILGIDCLRHYCIQLDFQAGKIRFLDSHHINTAELGKAFPLALQGGYPLIHHSSLTGNYSNVLIDVGCNIDGLVNKGAIKGLAELLPECIWDGETYTNLIIAATDHANVLGLNFLARHLVTLDFPKQTIYLKQTGIGPLDDSMQVSRLGAPMEFVEKLKQKNQLPGLSKDDKGMLYLEEYSNPVLKSATFEFRKNEDSSIYHYTISRPSENSPWKLQKAWQTDQNDHAIEEYPIHASETKRQSRSSDIDSFEAMMMREDCEKVSLRRLIISATRCRRSNPSSSAATKSSSP
jgi:hypothetical protein